MLLTDYVSPDFKKGKTLTQVHEDTVRLGLRVSWKTCVKAGSHGLPVVHEVAEKLSKATGGVCSTDEIKDPRKFMSAEKRAHFEQKDRERAKAKKKRARLQQAA
jgi:hypothetical protein